MNTKNQVDMSDSKNGKIVALAIICCVCFLGLCGWIYYKSNGPKDADDVKEAAVECVQKFVDALWNNDMGGSNLCRNYLNMFTDASKPGGGDALESKYCHEFNAFREACSHRVKINPEEVSYESDVKEVKEDGIFKYCEVEIRYRGKPIVFRVAFNGSGKTGTEGEAIILSTYGLYPFDNAEFKKASGFTLESDNPYKDDMAFYFERYWADRAGEFLKDSLKGQNKPDVEILSVKLDGNYWRVRDRIYDQPIQKDRIYEFLCSDNSVLRLQEKDTEEGIVYELLNND